MCRQYNYHEDPTIIRRLVYGKPADRVQHGSPALDNTNNLNDGALRLVGPAERQWLLCRGRSEQQCGIQPEDQRFVAPARYYPRIRVTDIDQLLLDLRMRFIAPARSIWYLVWSATEMMPSISGRASSLAPVEFNGHMPVEGVAAEEENMRMIKHAALPREDAETGEVQYPGGLHWAVPVEEWGGAKQWLGLKFAPTLQGVYLFDLRTGELVGQGVSRFEIERKMGFWLGTNVGNFKKHFPDSTYDWLMKEWAEGGAVVHDPGGNDRGKGKVALAFEAVANTTTKWNLA